MSGAHVSQSGSFCLLLACVLSVLAGAMLLVPLCFERSKPGLKGEAVCEGNRLIPVAFQPGLLGFEPLCCLHSA